MANKLFCVSGVSGVGKTTLMRYVMGMKKEIVSVTTRNPRHNEIDGTDYYFVNEEDFEDLKESDLMAESTTYYGRASYGVTKAEIQTKLSQGNSFITIDYNGYLQLKKLYPDNIVGIFMFADKDTIIERMVYRGESLENIQDRLKTYNTELDNMRHYDYILANNDFCKTAKLLHLIIRIESNE